MEYFNDMILNCNLHYIDFTGNAFTFIKYTIWKTLDRILFNDLWISHYPITQTEHLTRTLSDHSPLLLSISFHFINTHHPFRFQNM